MVLVLVGKENCIFDEDCTGSQDEGREQIDVNVVSGAVELSVLSRVKLIRRLFNKLSQNTHRLKFLLIFVKLHELSEDSCST